MLLDDTSPTFVPLYRQRTFSDKFADTMTFMRGQWRTLLMLMVYFILPLSMVLAILMPDALGFSMQGEGPDATSLLCMMFGSLAGIVLLWSIVFAVLRQYFYAPAKLQAPTFGSMWPDMRHCLMRSVILMLILGGTMMLVAAAYFVISTMLVRDPALLITFIIVSFPAMMCLTLPLGISTARTMLTDDGIWQSITGGYRLGYKTFGGVAAIVLVCTCLSSCVTSLCSLPMLACFIAKTLADGSSDVPFAETPLFALMQYLSNVLYLFAQFACSSLTLVALSFQYGHAAEKLEGTGVAYDIANFENL